MSPIRFDIASLHQAYGAGLSPLDVIEAAFDRLATANDPGIFIHVADKEAVKALAAGLGPFDPLRKPLWGVPFAVKDNIDVAGMPTTAACPAYTYTPEQDATVVALLRRAGALPIGKTNLDQFATGLVGVRTPYAVPKNALDPRLVPGGSSSGSAVAVARGIVAFALGTDTAGSGRIPAGLNNIVGMKPTLGALSTTGMVPACRTLDCVSVFALAVADAYGVFHVAARPDPSDPYSRAVAVPPLSARAPVLQVGVPAKTHRRFYGDRAMEAGFEAALSMLGSLGCRVVELPFEDFYAVADLLYQGAWVAERYAAIAEFMSSHEEAMHPVTRSIISGARELSAADTFKGIYRLQELKARLAPVIGSVDAICVPTAPTHYSIEAVLSDPIVTNSRLGTYTNFVNLLDLCGMAVPCGTLSNGQPMSITLLAPAGQDALVAALASDIHAESGLPLGATGWQQGLAAPPDRNCGDKGIELVVVGAHLSGMPLNHELKELGATFARAARTSPSYRLFALSGQAIPKPGMLRVNKGGVAIEVEVWRLDAAAFGRLVANIPPPLGIGAVTLQDGTSPKGFLVEAAAVEGSADISHWGGWRNFATANLAAS